MITRFRARQYCKSAAIGIGVLALAACTGTQDPSQAGFLDGVRNLSDGTYDRRIEQREQELATTRNTSDALAAELQASDTELAALSAEEQALRGRLSALQSQNARLQRDLTAAQQRADVDQAALAELQGQLSLLERQRTDIEQAAGGPALEAELRRLERETQELDAAINDILTGGLRVE